MLIRLSTKLAGSACVASSNIDPGDAARRVTSKTKAILPVHTAGEPRKMDAIYELASNSVCISATTTSAAAVKVKASRHLVSVLKPEGQSQRCCPRVHPDPVLGPIVFGKLALELLRHPAGSPEIQYAHGPCAARFNSIRI
jgi:hypothetical protein